MKSLKILALPSCNSSLYEKNGFIFQEVSLIQLEQFEGCHLDFDFLFLCKAYPVRIPVGYSSVRPGIYNTIDCLRFEK